jgi:succinate dehydrogenase / fumarate reductase flavoprotein subunit
MPTPLRTVTTNVLVVGAGAAALRAAIAAHDAGCEVRVLGSRARDDAHTVLAAGGINAALGTRDPEDEPRWHYQDTWSEGHALADPRKLELLVTEAPAHLRQLADWGMPFARTAEGAIDQRYFGAHRYRRTCYAGDWTGRAMLDTLLGQVDRRSIPVVDGCYVTHLLVEDGVCAGALAFDLVDGDRVAHLADAVVLATGGHTRLWRRSSSRRGENLGGGMALALRAGAELRDLELVQFHPTGMTHPEEWEGQLVTEAVRGEGGRLFNADGERFMERYDADRMELSARDTVALANYTEIQEGRGGPHGGVFLDLSHLDRDTIRRKVPRMYRQFVDAQLLDISERPMEVSPTAHYSMGGVTITDPARCTTTVEGLFAAGEVTAGLHGANRLGGNSLIETVVFGARAGAAAADRSRELPSQPRPLAALRTAQAELDARLGPGDELTRLVQRDLRAALWDGVGVVRDEDGLRLTLAELDDLEARSSRLEVEPDAQGHRDLAEAWELDAGLLLARATTLGALARSETRGAHQRRDHPDRDDDRHLASYALRLDDGELTLDRRPRPSVPDHLEGWAVEGDEIDTTGKLIE